MNLWEYLDRRSERRSHRPPMIRFDTKSLIGFGFLTGYYILVYFLIRARQPLPNHDLVRDAMLTLGPPVGAIVGAIFRETIGDQQSKANTAAAFEAIKVAAKAGTEGGGQKPEDERPAGQT